MARRINEEAGVTVILDGKQAAAEMQRLTAESIRLKSVLAEMEKNNDLAGAKKAQKELNKVNRELRLASRNAYDVNTVLKNLSGATMDQLYKAQRKLNAELRFAERGSEKWKKTVKSLRQVNQQIDSVNTEMRIMNGTQGTFFSSAMAGFNKYKGMAAAFLVTIGSIIFSFQKLTDTANAFEKKADQLSSLTGLVGDDLEWLKQQALDLSTSVVDGQVRITASANEILEGYKLVGSAKPELLAHKEALASVTEEAMILAEASGMLLPDAVKALTDTMNQFGAPADEARKYIDAMAAGAKYGAAEINEIGEAVVKFGVGAKAFNVTIHESVGLIELLGEKGLKGAVAGTKIAAILNRMSAVKGLDKAAQDNLKKYGVNLDLVSDKSIPLAQRLEEIRKISGDSSALLKVFGEENKNAAQAILTSIPRYEQLVSQVQEVGVATEQAAVNTDNEATKLKQAKNAAEQKAIALGSKLSPAMTKIYVLFSKTLGLLVSFIGWLEKNQKAIIGITKAIASLVIGYGAYNAAVILQNTLLGKATILTKAETWAKGIYASVTKAATGATMSFSAAMKTTPWGLVIGLAATAVALYASYSMELSSAEKTQKRLNEIERDHNDNLAAEVAKLNAKIEAIKRSHPGSEKRNQLMKEMNDEYGTSLRNYESEIEFLNQIDKAQKDVIKSLTDKINLEIKEEMLTELLKEKGKALEKVYEAQNKYFDQFDEVQEMMGDVDNYVGSYRYNQLSSNLSEAYDSLNDIEEKIKEVSESYAEMALSQPELDTSAVESDLPAVIDDPDEEAEKKAEEAQEKLEGLTRKIEAAHFELAQFTREEIDKQIAEINRNWAEEISMATAMIESGVAEKEKWIGALQKAIETRDAEIQQVLDIYRTAESEALDEQLTELDQLAIEKIQKRKDLLEEYGLMTTEERIADEQARLQMVYDQGIISFEEFERIKAEIAKRYRETESEESLKLTEEEFQKKQQRADAYFSSVTQATQAYSDIITSLKDHELSRIDDMEQRGVMSKENAEKKKKDIAKKYAIPEFLIKISSIIANTAQAIMQAFAQLGPIAGAIAAGLLTVTGGVQVGIAAAELNKVKAYAMGRYPVMDHHGNKHVARYGGKASTGRVNNPTLFLAGEEMPEMIIDGPTLRGLEINHPEAIKAIYATARVPAYADGFYPEMPKGKYVGSKESDERYVKAMEELVKVLKSGIKSKVYYREIQEMEQDIELIKNSLA